MKELLSAFVAELRRAGLPVSITESIDAAAALSSLPLLDPSIVRAGLRTTLVKSSGHEPAFDAAFDVYFSPFSTARSTARLTEQKGGLFALSDESREPRARLSTAELDYREGAGGGEGAPEAGADLDAASPGSGDLRGGGLGSGDLQGGDLGSGDLGSGGLGGEARGLSDAELAGLVYGALLLGAREEYPGLARLAVARYAAIADGPRAGLAHYLFRTLAGLDFESLGSRLATTLGFAGLSEKADRAVLARDGTLQELAVGPSDASGEGAAGSMSPLGQRLAGEEANARLEALRGEIESEILRLLVAGAGRDALAADRRRPLPEDLDFLHASAAELAAMRRSLGPLGRSLASRLSARRRRAARGRVDLSATLHRSVADGGVPAELCFRARRPTKPEIFVLADISGSVSSFARFTLYLVHSLANQFQGVRSFVFIDGLDEVTTILRRASSIGEAVQAVNLDPAVIAVDGHSDYGRALALFSRRYLRQVSAKTTVLVLGDARNNYHDTGAQVLAGLARRARRLYWLDPEPQAYWGRGDSVIGTYAPYCDAVVECRNLTQLARFVSTL